MNNQIISKFNVINFRNLENNQINFGPRINCIVGENGNGKTNILEAIHFLVNRKSFYKNTSFPQMLSTECEQPEIIFSSLFLDNDKNINYSGKWSKEGHSWFINGKKNKKKISLNTVFMGPFDSLNFYTSPNSRRSWFDQHAKTVDKEYKYLLNKYNKLLKFRNNLLKNKTYKYLEQIEAIDPEMGTISYDLIIIRERIIKEINSFAVDIFKDIFSSEHKIELKLKLSISNKNTHKEYIEALRKNVDKDVVIGHTHAGVHKDDYTLFFDGMDSFDFCSLGQQKMCYLSLIFAYIELFRYKYRVYPIVLIDDISGELDNRRWGKLIGYLKVKDFQVLITTANDRFKEELEKIEDIKRFNVSSGIVTSF